MFKVNSNFIDSHVAAIQTGGGDKKHEQNDSNYIKQVLRIKIDYLHYKTLYHIND